MKKEACMGKNALCWGCQNAVPGNACGCSWARHFQPVEGWKAVPEQLANVHGLSYLVQECPEFVPDNPKGWGGNVKGELFDEAYIRLAEGILERTFKSYRDALKSWKRRQDEGAAYELHRLETMIISPYFSTLTLGACDLLGIINSLREQYGLEPRSEDWRRLYDNS